MGRPRSRPGGRRESGFAARVSRERARCPDGAEEGDGRARQARSPYLESFTAFAALDLAFIALHQSAGVWPVVWIVARVVYLPLYLLNVVWVRSLVCSVALLALLMMLSRLAFH